MLIRGIAELDAVEQKVVKAAEKAAAEMRGSDLSGIEYLSGIKFGGFGWRPDNPDERLNLVEQVNQTFTYLVTFRGVRKLYELHPDVQTYRLNLGTKEGSDIEDESRQVVAAEVFAAVDPGNNQKLKKDILKVTKTAARHKYVFFCSPGHEPRLIETVGGVAVWTVGF